MSSFIVCHCVLAVSCVSCRCDPAVECHVVAASSSHDASACSRPKDAQFHGHPLNPPRASVLRFEV